MALRPTKTFLFKNFLKFERYKKIGRFACGEENSIFLKQKYRS